MMKDNKIFFYIILKILFCYPFVGLKMGVNFVLLFE